MAVTVNKKPRGRSGSLNGDGRHSLVHKWTVQSDDPAKGQDVIYDALKANGIELNMAHPTVPGHYLRTIQLDETSEDGLQWEAVGTFSQYDPGSTGGSDPLSAKAQFSVRSNIRQVPVDVDLDGKPVRNSARQRFAVPVTRDANDPVLTVVRNEEAVDPLFLKGLENTVNGTDFMGYPAGTVRYVTHEITSQRDPLGNPYVQVSYQFNVNLDGWIAKPIDQGTVHLEDGVQEPNYTEDWKAIRQDPVFLDGAGGVLAEDAEAVYLEFTIYEEVDYATIFNFAF